MSGLKYFSYKDYGVTLLKEMHYSQAVRVGDNIEISGQGKSNSSPLHQGGCPSVTKEVAVQESAPDFTRLILLAGGWDPKTGEVAGDLLQEIDQAFENVSLTLKDAGGEGWSQVFRIRLYALDEAWTPEGMGRMVENINKWAPDHAPILTGVGVSKLGQPGMRVEVEVSAYDPEGGKKAPEQK